MDDVRKINPQESSIRNSSGSFEWWPESLQMGAHTYLMKSTRLQVQAMEHGEREREARFECGSNSRLMIINTGKYQVVLVG
jgi:hypothetical protein